MAKYNDIDMQNWRDYSEIITDSLWLIDRRDNSGAHTADYHGNFIPQIPHQLLSRYTKQQDWVLDPFLGSGTTLIEAQRLGRNAVGLELQAQVAEAARQRIASEPAGDSRSLVLTGDSRNFNLAEVMAQHNIKQFQFVLLHPPYWDIIHFSDSPADLANAPTLEQFLADLAAVIENTTQHLEKNRYCAIVIADKYANSQVVPLGFHCMQLFLERGFLLKAILVKNFGETKGKSKSQGIWRYRALASDFYVFKHEYIFVFKKVKQL